ncbi:neurofilament heavy polypeptide isoform X2 [Syngnathoides biaculeatus]|uniref:neurofilament heavy polypeptide isoform X2 n=1 Tax=Syngnathoides biaculeatus TaxID=300417 RepID=UPI002ADDFAC9|nr:neurofilament heavy polypeptide isoform X2 [Syngnathoides biaculeatus]
MAATEASAAPTVQEDGKTPESKQTEAEQPAQNSETVNSEAADKDGPTGNSEVAATKETVENDTSADAAAGGEEEEAGAAGGEEATPQSSENHEHKTSFLDSFLNKSGLGKVMAGRKKKEAGATAGAGPEDGAAEGAEMEGEKTGDETAAEVGSEGEAAAEKALENGEKEDEKKGKESKSSVRDLIRKPVARIFSHRSTEKKDGNTLEPPKQIKVRSKSLDRLEDPEALNATADSAAEEVAGAEGGPEAETEQKASLSTTKHMKRWHSFKKLMAQKAHKKSSGPEDGADGEGGGDSSTLDSKESGQKRWKLKRSWTFQGLKRDTSTVGISGKTKTADKDSADKPEEARDADEEGGEEAEAGAVGAGDEDKADGSEEKAEGGEEEEKAAGGATVTQHANEIWTSFKKRVIPKSKRANTECQPGGEDDAAAAAAAAAAPPSGEDGAAEDGKDAKSAKAKRSHFGRAVSLKNFILRKGKSTSVDMGDAAAKEEEEEGAAPAEGGGDDVAAQTGDDSARRQEVEPAAREAKPGHDPVTNGENGCQNGTAEDDDAKKDDSPLRKAKELGGAKEETNAKVINTTAPPVNSDKKAGSA